MEESPKSLSIIIPAFNEEGNIRATYEEAVRLANKYLDDYEIIVIDDASTDKTADVVEELRKQNPFVTLIKNPVNKGLGYNYRVGVLNARYRYAIMIPGDNEVVGSSLDKIISQLGVADLILCYPANASIRPRSRQIVSRIFTGCLNILFRLNIRYYNGPNVVRVDLARKFSPQTSGFAYMAVIVTRAIKGGFSYRELSFDLKQREFGSTKAFRLKNFFSVAKDISLLFFKIYFKSPVQLHKQEISPSLNKNTNF